TINKAEVDDQAVYHFRIEKGRRLRYSYLAEEEKVSVIVTEKIPDITFSGLLRAGHEASITCTAQWSPSSRQPIITWTGFSERSRGEITQHVSRNGVESHVDFTPTASDHLQNITCKATYFRGDSRVTVERTVTLIVFYPPKKIEFSGQLERSNGEVRYFTNISQIVAREGDSLVVHCDADGNPKSTAVWKLRFPATRLFIYNNKLTLSKIALEDAAPYICTARNIEGHTKESFHLQIS
ncbi:sialic acid-binding Ig-like lectin 14, partial [Eublepharis macularius]|uniref:Sialic acid-binding Ig-like lectin 14 n=1 Tax=Eublepharis macularius TaxID=481883 RepID=A0AA97KDF6_EUBMA